MEPIIQIKNISKNYKITHQAGGYLTLRDIITYILKHPFRFLKKKVKQVTGMEKKEEFWALKDIDLEIQKGEVVGIIGRNGAGKSTLLKILSRITPPTTGEIIMRGQVGSLLEVGTGFNSELTGRENISLNGAILGMTRSEIASNFDKIVEFSGVEKFIDTPVKYYSSGMRVRLAFSVAAHLEPDILIIDEVLSVGDAEFQKKCLGKMDEVTKKEGRTILFVSHNMDTVRKLCKRTIVLEQGRIIKDGPTDEVVSWYMEEKVDLVAEKIWPDINLAPGDKAVRIHSVRALDRNGKVSNTFDVHDPVNIEVEYDVLEAERRVMLQLYFYNEMEHCIFTSSNNLDSPWKDTVHPKGHFRSVCQIPGDFLNECTMSMSYRLIDPGSSGTIYTTQSEAVKIEIIDRMDPQGVRGNYQLSWRVDGVRPRFPWKVEKTQ